jgi:transmembrane sensor
MDASANYFMTYATYTAVDFALDERFRRWVLNPTLDEDLFWGTMMRHSAQHRVALGEARTIVLRLRVHAEQATTESIYRMWSVIQAEK